MIIGLISPTFPPDRCGVGDHSAQLKQALENQGHKVILWKTLPNLSETFPQVDAFFIQYTPSIWAKNFAKLNFNLVTFCKKARKKNKVFMMVHELHYPVNFSPRGLIYGVGQYLQFRTLIRNVDWVFFSYGSPQIKYPAHSSVLPVGSNIAFSPLQTKSETRADIRLVHFGGAHPTHLIDWTVKAFNRVREAFPHKKVELVWVGQDAQAKKKILGDQAHPFIHTRNYLPEDQISEELQRADLILAPFMDGVSTRRGTFMAALVHGLPVITTRGWATDPKIPWKEFCAISEMDPTAYADLAVDVLTHLETQAQLKQNAKTAYEEKFSWKQIAKKLINQIETTTKAHHEH